MFKNHLVLFLMLMGIGGSLQRVLGEQPISSSGEQKNRQPGKKETYSPLKPPRIELQGVTKSPKACSFTFKLWNHNNRTIGYMGYSPDSFSPPLPKGMLVYQVQFKRDGKWRRYPQGLCGTGLTFLKLAPMRHEVFGVTVTEDLAADWEAVKVGIAWSAIDLRDLAAEWAQSKLDLVVWSDEITREKVALFKQD